MTIPRVAETHISTLFFTDDRVFKLLKPVQNGFLDHRDAATRCEAASTEVELNRRLSPDIYLGTADVVENGELVDRMIVMRRLPADRSLTSLLRHGELDDEHIRTVTRALANFHSSLPSLKPARPLADTQRDRWAENFAEIRDAIGPVLSKPEAERIEKLAMGWLESHGTVLDQRVSDGFVVDGHGDLTADDIFLTDDGPAVLDCLAFRDDFRQVDVLDDIAFLAMDLHRLSGPYWAQRLLRYYQEFTGETHPSSLAHYYLAYRAHVRCKVACLRWKGGEVDYGEAARMYHKLCLDHLERARLRVLLVGGGPASGKTTLARALGEQLGAAVLSSDEVRKDLARVDRTEHHDFALDSGIYSPEFTVKTYDELLRRSELLLASGESVVIDATWARDEERKLAADLAEKSGAQLIPIECSVPLAIAQERIVRRSANVFSISDATPEIAEQLNARREPWADAIAIDSARPFHEVETTVLVEIRCFGQSGSVGKRERGESFWGAHPEARAEGP